MSTGVILLFSAFILLCTGSGRRFSQRLSLAPGTLAGSCLLLAAASAFTFFVSDFLSVHLASVLLAAVAIYLCRKESEIYVSILLAFLCGILGWFLLRLFPDFFEPALPLALPAVLLSQLLPAGFRQQSLCVSLSPLFFGLIATLEDWYLFDSFMISFGSTMQYNTQILGLFLLAVCVNAPLRDTKKAFNTQKEY